MHARAKGCDPPGGCQSPHHPLSHELSPDLGCVRRVVSHQACCSRKPASTKKVDVCPPRDLLGCLCDTRAASPSSFRCASVLLPSPFLSSSIHPSCRCKEIIPGIWTRRTHMYKVLLLPALLVPACRPLPWLCLRVRAFAALSAASLALVASPLPARRCGGLSPVLSPSSPAPASPSPRRSLAPAPSSSPSPSSHRATASPAPTLASLRRRSPVCRWLALILG